MKKRDKKKKEKRGILPAYPVTYEGIFSGINLKF